MLQFDTTVGILMESIAMFNREVNAWQAVCL